MKVTCSRRRCGPGFTLVELLVVIVVIGLLVALLLPALAAGMRRAREASVQAEIGQLAQALAAFRIEHDEYPPSRVLLCEDGDYGPYLSGAAATTAAFATPGIDDMSTAQLALRSLIALRRCFPRLTLSTSGAVYKVATGWPDYNGNGVLDGPRVIEGDECLVLFLGGMPTTFTGPGGAAAWAVRGMGRMGRRPFPSNADDAEFRPPLYEFRGDRLADPDKDGFPSYLDPYAGKPYAYFSSYGGSGYDPNDVNFSEADELGGSPLALRFRVDYRAIASSGGGTTNLVASPAPNPYTSTTSAAPSVRFLMPQSFQILASGGDGLYGVGGYYAATSPEPLPIDASNTLPGGDTLARGRERDNLASFHGGRLD